jgi:DNA mismatch repair protein PMS2
MLRVVQAYALFATGVKFVMINVTKGARQTVLSTQKTSRIEDNICNIFGSKFLSTLQVFSTPVLSSTELENNGDVSAEGELAVPQRLGDVTGYISKIGLGIGRSDNDRQFIFCNGRPIDLPRLVKAVNEIWRKYEMKQKPAFIIDIRINRNSVDVNLAPNKREVLIENEELLIEQFRNAIDSMYSSSKNVLEVNSNLEIRKLTDFSAFSALSTQAEIKSSQATNSNDSSSRSTEIAGRDIPVEHRDTAEISPAISHPDVSAISHSNLDSHVSESKEVTWASPAEQSRLAQVVTSQESVALRDQTIEDNDRGPIEDEWISSSFSKIPWSFTSTRKRALNNVYESANCSEPIRKQGDLGVKRRRQEALSLTAESENNNSLENINSSVRIIDKNDFSQMRVIGQFNLGFIIVELDGDMYILDQHACDEKFRFEKLQKNTKLNNQPLLKPLVVEMTAALESVVEDNLDVFESNGFELGIDDSAPAGRRISMRSMPFSKGIQFGVTDVVELASLICGDDGEDFYDGRMNKNYLSLRNESMFKSQSLPSSLASTKKAVPKVLLPKIMAMFASRACRSAVMIGTALNRKEMLSIVNQMVSVEQPWNCPHGRPTMRHLFDYDTVVAASTNNDWNETDLKSSEISLEKLNQLGKKGGDNDDHHASRVKDSLFLLMAP